MKISTITALLSFFVAVGFTYWSEMYPRADYGGKSIIHMDASKLPYRELREEDTVAITKFPREVEAYYSDCIVCADCQVTINPDGSEVHFRDKPSSWVEAYCTKSAIGSVLAAHPSLEVTP